MGRKWFSLDMELANRLSIIFAAIAAAQQSCVCTLLAQTRSQNKKACAAL
jgi:hypothetical protein